LTTAARKKPRIEENRRRASFLPQTLDEEARTIEAVAVTETPVPRWYGDEILRVAEEAIDQTRIGQMPVLDTHNRQSVAAILGRVERVRIEGRKLIATIKFADTDAGRNAMALAAQGMIRAVSVGYSYALDDATETKRDGVTVRTIERWQPFEISLVSVPADPNATVRGHDMNRRKQKAQVSDLVDDTDLDDGEVIERDPPRRTEERQISTRAERQIERVRSMALDQGLDEEEVDEALDGVTTAEGARAALFDHLAGRSRTRQTTPNRGASSAGHDAEDVLQRQTIEALAVRLGAKPPQNSDNPLLGRPVIEIGRSYFERSGVSLRNLTDDRVVGAMLSTDGFRALGGMHTTSDFPFLLQEAGNRTLQERFQALPSAIKSVSARRDAQDFRQQSFIRPGEAPKLEKIGEAGEVTFGTLKEEKNGLTLDTYGKVFTLTRKALINDNLGAFSDFLNVFANSALVTEGDLLFDLLAQNSFGGIKLSDGKNFFHADHGNLAGAGAAISTASVGAARAAMRKQSNVNGTGRAGVVPAILLVGPDKETEAQQFVAPLAAADQSNANPFVGKLRIEVEDRLEGNRWYLFADPNLRPALAYGYLQGQTGPRVDTREGWNVLGTEFRCFTDFGCAPFDYRAAYCNPGA
jgi:HK97 family phage prohead protease